MVMHGTYQPGHRRRRRPIDPERLAWLEDRSWARAVQRWLPLAAEAVDAAGPDAGLHWDQPEYVALCGEREVWKGKPGLPGKRWYWPATPPCYSPRCRTCVVEHLARHLAQVERVWWSQGREVWVGHPLRSLWDALSDAASNRKNFVVRLFIATSEDDQEPFTCMSFGRLLHHATAYAPQGSLEQRSITNLDEVIALVAATIAGGVTSAPSWSRGYVPKPLEFPASSFTVGAYLDQEQIAEGDRVAAEALTALHPDLTLDMLSLAGQGRMVRRSLGRRYDQRKLGKELSQLVHGLQTRQVLATQYEAKFRSSEGVSPTEVCLPSRGQQDTSLTNSLGFPS